MNTNLINSPEKPIITMYNSNISMFPMYLHITYKDIYD